MRRLGAVFALFLASGSAAVAQTSPAPRPVCPPGAPGKATILAVDGDVRGRTALGQNFSVDLQTVVCPGDELTTGEDGRIELSFTDQETTIGVGRNSTIRIPAPQETDRDIDFLQGLLRFISSVPQFFQIRTRHANAGIDGTEASLVVDADDTLVLVAEGEVGVSDLAGGPKLDLLAGQAATAGARGVAAATAATAPAKFRALLANTDGASDWAIHYPPIFLAAGAGPEVTEAARLLEAGNPDGAERVLTGTIPGADRAAALALRAVVAVFRGRPDEGAMLAEDAVATDPRLPAAAIAESYALQANGDVEGARDAARRATRLGPQDAFAFARLAELELVLGNERRAGRAADQAVALQPSALAHAIRGFLALSAHRRAEADIEFLLAVRADSEAPLPRLGQALAAIRAGRAVEGRRLLELAASLNPRDASLRTWLGRAYVEMDDPEKANAQFDLAKERDPDDPTPYLLQAAVLFAENRPVEALREVNAARERGDNRSVLRSERGLGEDRAVTGAAIGRLLDTLGFTEQAIEEAERAVEEDRTNEAALRLLADVYREREGVEISRSSTVLAAQVYGAPSKAPIDPVLAESDLALFDVSGPARATFGEFTPFFEEDGLSARITGFAGTQATYGDSASFNALAEGFSIGIGQFHTETDGFRINNDVRHDLVNVIAKGQVLPWLDIFGEYRYRNTVSGDRGLEFDLVPELAPDIVRNDDERNLVRGGFHARISGSQDLAGLATFVNQQVGVEVNGTTTSTTENEFTEGQLQHVGRFGPLTTVSGGFFSDGAFDDASPFIPVIDVTHGNGYAYGTYRFDDLGFFAGAEVTVGISVDFFDASLFTSEDEHFINPKAGLRLFLTDDTVFRAAFTRTVKPVQLLDQRLEPVTVAGFPQFFDVTDGAVTRQFGLGLDSKITPWLSAGVEGSLRRTEAPESPFVFIPGTFDTTDEQEISAYLDATFRNRWAGSFKIRHLESDSELLTDLPEFRLTELEASLSWFHPSGFFASGGVGYVFHSFTESTGMEFSDSFPIGRLSLGFRLPKERGLISLNLENVFESDFAFEDRPNLSAAAGIAEPRFAREFTALGRVTLNF